MLERRLSGYEIERRSSRKISQSYFNRIKAGQIVNPSPEKLKAIADGMGISEEHLFAIVRGITPDSKSIAHEGLNLIFKKFEQLPTDKSLTPKFDYLLVQSLIGFGEA